MAVIGGGPAGAAAATRLARGGASVLLLEKGPLGRDKPCGGGLTARAWAEIEAIAPGAAQLVGATVTSTEVRHGAGRTAVVAHADAAVRMVRRCDLDRLLLEVAIASGAEVRPSEAATGLSVAPGGCVVTTATGEYAAGHVLLATGSEGRLRRDAGLRPPRAAMVPALEVEVRATVGSVPGQEVILDFGVPRGYAWAFPKGDEWNVGVLSLDRRVGPSLRAELERFVERAQVRCRHGDALTSVKGRRIPMWTGRRSAVAGRAAAIGDCAGLADAFFGEGISHALMSGRLAADALLAQPDEATAALASYDRELSRRLAPHLSAMLLMSRITYRWPSASVGALARSRAFRSVVRRAVFGRSETPAAGPATSRAA